MPTSKSLRKESDAVRIRSFGMGVDQAAVWKSCSAFVPAEKYAATEIFEAIRNVHAGKRAIPTAVAAQLAQHLSDQRLTKRNTTTNCRRKNYSAPSRMATDRAK
jgi:DNA-binding NarL/FixJ family response regulator